jgi:hypothetical protein
MATEELDEDEDRDDDEEDDDEDDETDEIQKDDLLDDLLEAIGSSLDDYVGGEVILADSAIELELNDDSKWRLTLRKVE